MKTKKRAWSRENNPDWGTNGHRATWISLLIVNGPRIFGFEENSVSFQARWSRLSRLLHTCVGCWFRWNAVCPISLICIAKKMLWVNRAMCMLNEEISEKGICEIRRIFCFDTTDTEFNRRGLYRGFFFSFPFILTKCYIFLLIIESLCNSLIPSWYCMTISYICLCSVSLEDFNHFLSRKV